MRLKAENFRLGPIAKRELSKDERNAPRADMHYGLGLNPPQ